MINNLQTKTTTSIKNHDLNLTLSLSSPSSSSTSSTTITTTQFIPLETSSTLNGHNNMTVRLLDEQVIIKRDLKRKAQVTSICVGSSNEESEITNMPFNVNWGRWNNGGGLKGQYGNFVSEGKDCSSSSNSISSGCCSGVSENYQCVSAFSVAGTNSSETGSNSSHPDSHLPSPSIPIITSQLNHQSNNSDSNHSKPESSNSPEKPTTPSSINSQQNGAPPNINKDSDPTRLSIKREIRKPPRPNGAMKHPKLLISEMPCVSTTGNGPNGKTINGFLYKYTKGEVSIICVCHGSSFSPAGFVEHAGGVGVEYPLRHIKVDSFGFS